MKYTNKKNIATTNAMLSVPNRTKRLTTGFLLAAAVTLAGHDVLANPMAVNLGTAAQFGILAGSAVTITGPTTINGNLGSSPTPAITGLGSLTLNGVNEANNSVAQTAHNDLATAISDAASRTPTTTYAAAYNLGGQTLTPGVYNSASSLYLTGTLTLDGLGDPNAVFIIQAGSTLTGAAASSVVLTDGAQAANVFWEIGSSATLGADTAFVGSLLAETSVTLGAGSDINGRVLALNGAITMANNTINVPVASGSSSQVADGGSTLLMLGLGLMIPLGLSRRFATLPCLQQ